MLEYWNDIPANAVERDACGGIIREEQPVSQVNSLVHQPAVLLLNRVLFCMPPELAKMPR